MRHEHLICSSLLIALDLGRAFVARNDLLPVPAGESLTPEERLRPCDQTEWPFVAPPDMAEKIRRQFSHTQLLRWMDKIPFYSHTVLDYRLHGKAIRQSGLPTITPDEYEAYMLTEPWPALGGLLPTQSITFTLDNGPTELCDFWQRLIAFNRENVRWFWERTHYFAIPAKAGVDRKQRNSHVADRWLHLTKGLLPLIQAGLVDIDVLLEPALMRLVKTGIAVFPPSSSVVDVDDFVQELDRRWPERLYYLDQADLHISAHPAVQPRIAGKFDLATAQ